MSSTNIFAYTETPTPSEGYAEYISINRDEHGVHTITIRSSNANTVTIPVSVETLEHMATDIIAYLHRDGAV